MRTRGICRCMVFFSALGLVGQAALEASAQVSRRGYSSRGVSSAGARTPTVRSPVITGARSNYNVRYGAGGLGPLAFPNNSGFYYDMSSPYFYPGDFGQSGFPGEGETGAGGESGAPSTPSVRPTIRPRLNLSDRNAVTSNTVLAGLNSSVQQLIAASPEKPFSKAWYAAHPQVLPVALTRGNAWQRPRWSDAQELLGIGGDPLRYDFRPDDIGLIYVHRNETRQERAVDARAAAIQLADSQLESNEDSESISLGVFAAVSPLEEPVSSLLNLALDNSGNVSGYLYEFGTDDVQALRGAVDPATQRVAWRVGDNYGEAGLKNLTEDVARFLLFKSDGWTQPWILIRMSE